MPGEGAFSPASSVIMSHGGARREFGAGQKNIFVHVTNHLLFSSYTSLSLKKPFLRHDKSIGPRKRKSRKIIRLRKGGTYYMRKWTMASVAAAMAMFLCTAVMVHAATTDDAKGMVEKAYSYFKANGKDKAYAEISSPHGQFVKGELYVFVQDFNGVNLANGGNQSFVGQNHMGLKDPNGKYFIKEMVEMAKSKGTGWVNYEWVNPETKKIQAKATYVKRIEGSDSFMACGVFK
jgi:cytochrome c